MKSLKQMLTIVNDENIGYNELVYSQYTDTIKTFTIVTNIIINRLVEHCESSNNYFQFKEPKTTGKKGFYIGSVQLVTKNTSRFDVTQFKKDHPELYTQYLTGGVSNELRTNYKLEVK